MYDVVWITFAGEHTWLYIFKNNMRLTRQHRHWCRWTSYITTISIELKKDYNTIELLRAKVKPLNSSGIRCFQFQLNQSANNILVLLSCAVATLCLVISEWVGTPAREVESFFTLCTLSSGVTRSIQSHQLVAKYIQ